jgi:hypothetical protein
MPENWVAGTDIHQYIRKSLHSPNYLHQSSETPIFIPRLRSFLYQRRRTPMFKARNTSQFKRCGKAAMVGQLRIRRPLLALHRGMPTFKARNTSRFNRCGKAAIGRPRIHRPLLALHRGTPTFKARNTSQFNRCGRTAIGRPRIHRPLLALYRGTPTFKARNTSQFNQCGKAAIGRPSSCHASGNANDVQGKGAYSIQATLQNIEDWSTQVSPYSASKDANHQGQNSHAPFQGKEDLTSQLVRPQQRPANSHALTLDEHASRAKAATSTSYGAAMRFVGCNQYQALMPSIAEFLHTREVRRHDRVGCWDGEGSFVSVVAGYSRIR